VISDIGDGRGMRYDEMIKAVREEGGIAADEHAEKVLRATTAVLGERLSGNEPGNLRDQLPAQLRTELPTTGPGRPFDAQQFLERVAEREGLGCSDEMVLDHVRAVLRVIFSAESAAGEKSDVAAQLPQDLRALLGAA
jgi:uncharacterized protein (DUF2267 family)